MAESSPAPRIIPSAAILALVIAMAFPVIAWFGFQRHGTQGILAAAIAATVCLLSGVVALVVTGLSQGTSSSATGLLASMGIRTGLPLAVGLILSSSNEALASAGVFGMILVYYFIMLAVETTLAVRLINANRPSESKSP